MARPTPRRCRLPTNAPDLEARASHRPGSIRPGTKGLQENAHRQASATHARPRDGGARGRILPRRRRHAPVPPGRGRHRGRLRPRRPPRSAVRPGPDRQRHPVAAADDHPAGRGAGRDDRARDGRPGGAADRQLPGRDRRPRVPRLRRLEPGLRRGARAGRHPSNRTGRARPWSSSARSPSARETRSWRPTRARPTA